MKTTRRAFLAAGGLTAAVAFNWGRWALTSPGNSGSTDAPTIAQANRVVNLYSARHYDTDSQLYKSFTDKTGIKVNLVEAEADALIERIKSEGPNSPADIFMTVDIARLWRAANEGILAPSSSATLNRSVPASLRDPDGLWYGLTQRARVIVYNKAKVNPKEIPTTISRYEELVDSKWRGRLLMRSSENVYNQSLTASIIAAHGLKASEEWAKGLVANFARPPEGNDTAQIKAVAAGVGDLTLANTYYIVRLMKSDKPQDKAVAENIGVLFPNQDDRGTHVNVSGAGIIKTSRNKDAAIQFLEHLTMPEAQEIFARSNNEYPVREGVTLDPILASLGEFKRDSVNAAVIGRNTPEAIKLMDRAGWK